MHWKCKHLNDVSRKLSVTRSVSRWGGGREKEEEHINVQCAHCQYQSWKRTFAKFEVLYSCLLMVGCCLLSIVSWSHPSLYLCIFDPFSHLITVGSAFTVIVKLQTPRRFVSSSTDLPPDLHWPVPRPTVTRTAWWPTTAASWRPAWCPSWWRITSSWPTPAWCTRPHWRSSRTSRPGSTRNLRGHWKTSQC